ncbi:hypothetical protein DV738_g32, partial [Chaetothyriales sp. CBS 135597]
MVKLEDPLILAHAAEDEFNHPLPQKHCEDGRIIYLARNDYGQFRRAAGVVRITDFDLAVFGDKSHKGCIQADIYRAPEVILDAGYTYSADIWSLGVMLWDLLEGKALFKTDNYDEQKHLASITALLGEPPRSLLAQGDRTSLFYGGDGRLQSRDLIPTDFSFGTTLLSLSNEEKRLFIEFIQKMIRWQPSERIREPLEPIENYQSRILDLDGKGEEGLSTKRKRGSEPANPMAQTPSPTKRLRSSKSVLAQNLEDDSTPRPQHPAVDSIIPSTSRSGSSVATSRSASPTKRKADFDLMYPRIRFNEDSETFTDEEWELPDRIRKASVRVPEQMRGYLEEHPFARRNLDNIKWQEAGDHSHTLSQMQDFWARVQRIAKAAALCSGEIRSEESWSDDVVLEILRLALSWSGLEDKLMVANLKSVKVDQPALLPVRNLQRVASKKVDYGFCLKPTPEEGTMILNVLQNMSDPLPSINQSAVPMLRNRALFSSLEIKKAYGNQDPVPQLGVWSTAGLTKLSSLARDSKKRMMMMAGEEPVFIEEPDVPILPSLTVEGHRWQVRIARRCSPAETVIVGPFCHWSTESIVEIIFIVNAAATYSSTATPPHAEQDASNRETVYEYNWIDGAESLEKYEPGGYHPIMIGDTLHGGRYRVVDKLGFGGYSTVWLARDTLQGRYVAVKVGIANSSLRETNVLSVLSTRFQSTPTCPGHSAIPLPLDEFEVDGPNGKHFCYTTTPARCNLREVSFSRLFPLDAARALSGRLILAIAYLHSQGYAHGDIHLRNVLVKLPSTFDHLSVDQLYEQYGEPETIPIKRCDGEQLPPNIPARAVLPIYLGKYAEEFLPSDARVLLGDFGEAFAPDREARKGEDCHTPLAMRPPESRFEPQAYLSYSADIWSLATAIWEILGMKAIFSSEATVDELTCQQIDVLGPVSPKWWELWEERSQFFDDNGHPKEGRDVWPPINKAFEEYVQSYRRKRGAGEFGEEEKAAILDLMSRMLKFQPVDRPTANEVLQSEWVVKWVLPDLKRHSLIE